MLDGELIQDAAELAAILPSWEALAVANRLPMAMPEWTLAWFRHLAPAGTRLRVVVVRERGEVIGVAPLFVREDEPGRVDYRVAAAEVLPRMGPLAVPDREWEVATVMGRLLHDASPQVDAVALECHPLASHWPQALARTWPTKLSPVVAQYAIQPSPVVCLRGGDFDDWLAGKPPKLRSDLRRRRRRFQEAGGTVRVSTAETLDDDVATLLRLHRQRWEGRGESSIVRCEKQMHAFFREVGEAYVRDGAFRLILLEVQGRPIAAHVHGAAGGEVLFMNGGWDEAYARLSPSVLCVVAAVEDAFARGDHRLDLAPGAQPYKLRMADGDDPVAWSLLMIPCARLPLTVARTAPMLATRRARGFAKRALPEHQVARLRAAHHHRA